MRGSRVKHVAVARTDRLVEPLGMRPWLIVAVLFLVQMANWVDKTVVSLAANEIMAEFHLSTEEYGMIGGAFFSLYAITGLFVAFVMAPRFQARKILMVLLLCWSVVQIPVAIVASFPVLIVSRILLGMGEGAATPTTLNCAHEWFPDKARGMPSAVIIFGATAGAMIAAPALTAIIQDHGWRMAFLACAAFGMIVLTLWLLVSRPAPYAAAIANRDGRQAPAEPGMARRLWSDPTLIGVTIVGMMAYWITGFQVSWLAPYLMGLAGDPQRGAWILAIILGCQAASVIGLTFISQAMLNRGLSSRVARGGFMGLAMAVGGLCLSLIPFAPSPTWAIVLVGITMSVYGIASPMYASIISEVTPVAERNRVMTVILSILTLAAIPSSIVTGYLIEAIGWAEAVAMNGMAAFIGAAACFFLIDPARSKARLEPRVAETVPDKKAARST